MNEFIVSGRVTRADRTTGVGGLVVDVSDRDWLFYEALGSVTTDEDGRFQLTYAPQGLEALFHARPEIAIVVRDAGGVVVDRRDAGRCESGTIIDLEIVLSDEQVDMHAQKRLPMRVEPGDRLLDRRAAIVEHAARTSGGALVGSRVSRLLAALPPLVTSAQVVEDALAALKGDADAVESLRRALIEAERYLAPEEVPGAEVEARFQSEAAWRALESTLKKSGGCVGCDPGLINHEASVAVLAASLLCLARDRGEALRFAAIISASLWRIDRLRGIADAALPRDGRASTQRLRDAVALLGRTRLPDEPQPMQLMGGGGFGGGGLPGGGLPGGGLPGGGLPGGGLPGGGLPGGGLPGGGLPGGWEPGDPICPDPFPPWPDRFRPKFPPLEDRWLCITEIILLPTFRWLLIGIDRPHACPGETITLSGFGFGPAASGNRVRFVTPTGSTLVAATSWTGTSIQVVVPPDATCGRLSLRIPGGSIVICGRVLPLNRLGTSTVIFEGGATRVASLVIGTGSGQVTPGSSVPISYRVCNATSVRLRVSVDGGASLLDVTTAANSGSYSVTAPVAASNRTLRARIDAAGPCGSASAERTAIVQQAYALSVDGLEVTQAIQYYRANQHLTDPADIGPDNSVPLTAGKAGLVRVYLRSGGVGSFNGGRLDGCTGTLLVERRVNGDWTTVSTLNPLNGPLSAEATIAYDTERSALPRTLNFAVPAATMTGMLRFTASVSSPNDGLGTVATRAETVTIDRTRTLQVAAVTFGFTPPAPAPAIAAPTAAQVTQDLNWALRALPVQATPTVRIIATQNLTAVNNGPVPAGGCDPAWNALLTAVATARTNDGAQATWAYYGFVAVGIPFNNPGCSNGTVAASVLGNGLTVGHEIGHSLGLPHAPCGAVGTANANYPLYQPYDTGTTTTNANGATVWQDASTGEYGVDVTTQTVFRPATSQDFMSYCGPRWVSLFTWNFLGAAGGLSPTTVPAGSSELGERMSASTPDPVGLVTVLGSVGRDGKVQIDRVLRSVGQIGRAPGPKSDLVLELRTRDGEVLSSSPAFRTEGCAGAGCDCAGGNGGCGCGGSEGASPARKPPKAYRFQAVLVAPSVGDALVLLRGEDEVWRRERGERRALSARATVDRERGIRVGWKGADEGVWVRGSTDGGKTWNVLAVDLNGDSFDIPRHLVQGDRVELEVVSDDGFEHAVARIEGALDLGDRPPTIAIVRPAEGGAVRAGQPIHLWGALLDAGTRGAQAEDAVWTIDDAEVARGIEAWVPALEPGQHQITLALKGAESISVAVTVEK
jgi:hypothetical protein